MIVQTFARAHCLRSWDNIRLLFEISKPHATGEKHCAKQPGGDVIQSGPLSQHRLADKAKHGRGIFQQNQRSSIDKKAGHKVSQPHQKQKMDKGCDSTGTRVNTGLPGEIPM